MLTTWEEHGANAEALLLSGLAGANGTCGAELSMSGLNADALLLRGVRVLAGFWSRADSRAAGDTSSTLEGL